MDTTTSAYFAGQQLTKPQLLGLLDNDDYWDGGEGDFEIQLDRERLDQRLVAKRGDYEGCTILDAVALDPEYPEVVLFGVDDEEAGGFPYFLGVLQTVSSSRWHQNDVGQWYAEEFLDFDRLCAMLRKHGIEPTADCMVQRTVLGYACGLG